MTKELELALVRDFPSLYKDYGGHPRVTCMAWGFAVPDEWEPIIRELSERLKEEAPEVVAAQVKEKWGGLRFYFNPYNEIAEKLVWEALKRGSYRD